VSVHDDPRATDGVSRDALFDGAVELLQPATGYRANVDALLLAAFARSARPAGHAVDLGAGVGTVALALGYFGAAERVTLVERDPTLVDLARRNMRAAGLPGRVVEADVAAELASREDIGAADLVVCNPPFFTEDEGRPRSHPRDRAARSGALAPFLRSGRALLRDSKSRFCVVYPARSLAELLGGAANVALVPKRLRLVHSLVDRAARLALVELRAARSGGLVVEPPLIEWASPGVRSAELTALVRPRTDDRT
jgi:tRNA1(Val) A37 N6-methylase TrmN6